MMPTTGPGGSGMRNGGSQRDGTRVHMVPPPNGVGDLPRFLRELIGGFFFRLSYIFRLVWQTGPWILFIMSFVSLFQGVMPIVGSLLSQKILNELQEVIAKQAADSAGGIAVDVQMWADSFIGSTAMFLLIFLFTYRILNHVVNRVNHAVTRIAGELVVRRVKTIIMQKAATLDLASFDMPEFYEKLENANREAGNRPIQILSSTFSVISTVISFVGYILILSADMPLAAVGILAVTFPSALVNFIYRRKHFAYMRFRSRDRREMNYYSDLLVNKDIVKEIRMFDLSEHFIASYESVFRHYFKGLRRLIVAEGFWHVFFAILSACVNCLCYGYVALGVFTGKFKIGDYSLYTGSLNSIANDVSSLISSSASIYEGTLFIDNLIVFLKEEQTVSCRLETPVPVAHGEGHTLEFVNVSFRYPGTDRDVIRNVNLRFRPGETVVLVGLNGAGKTTLIKLLTRLYDPTEGQILLDGHDLRDYEPSDLYRMFGIIFQDFGRYAVSVEDNIHFGDIHREKNPAEIRQAADEANATYIDRLQNGYDTQLMRIFDKQGTELSGGQWQKLAIARAFYSTSDVLILDEPTASLDPIAEQEIFNQFDRLRQGKTTIFVSHRLSSATVASKIVVLLEGEVIEQGTHDELMESRGRYYELFSTQAKRYLAEEDRIREFDSESEQLS